MTLNGQRIVVLGGSSGIGLATAQAASREGARVVITSSSKERIEAALVTVPTGSEGHVLDLADGDAIKALFARLGSFDHLVFTAGETLQLGSLATTDLDAARRFFALRYWGAYCAAKYGQQQHPRRRLDRIHLRHRRAAPPCWLGARCEHLRRDGGTDACAGGRTRTHSRQHRLARCGENAIVVEYG
jgi:NAD(P)-dependent dehydrogenase (short-subunit alcohol dehydrogenase family)